MTSHLQFHEGTVFEKKMLMARILQLGSHHMVGFQWISGKSYIYTPMGSMYGILCIFTYIWLMCMVNVGKYTIHGSYGICIYIYIYQGDAMTC